MSRVRSIARQLPFQLVLCVLVSYTIGKKAKEDGTQNLRYLWAPVYGIIRLRVRLRYKITSSKIKVEWWRGNEMSALSDSRQWE